MVTDLARLKIGLRRFLARDTSNPATLTWDTDKNLIDINRAGRGMSLVFPADAMNAEGDYLTDENKQNIVTTLTAIVDEHNSQI